MLCCDYRLVANTDTFRLGLAEARAGVPFPAGPVAIMKHELPAALLRQLTMSSRTLGPGILSGYGVVDDLTDPGKILQNAVSAARDLAAQPAFKIVKRQVRGALGAELRLFATDFVRVTTLVARMVCSVDICFESFRRFDDVGAKSAYPQQRSQSGHRCLSQTCQDQASDY